ncbi:hypothetical protein [Pontibacter chinhatensis]|uniref:Uncharacterized protein n=1 Tax=Pontibacter chinhatensis TaxID=1436961 RepID=A0A1I2ZMR6_9BACT|nr:hypothetical protein [Pontibacter chinhatensis]SFH39044.1 hypothetical protein SAMN05421739_11612 [Pontibacter chinhatensis]
MENNQQDKKTALELEMEALIQASRATSGHQLGLGEEVERIVASSIIGAVQSPEKAYDLYYKALYSLLKTNLSNLPQAQRDMIYDQKNIFLTRGKVKDSRGIRGGDSRQAYLEDMEAALEIVIDWVNEGANPVNLYNAFRDKNRELNYI